MQLDIYAMFWVDLEILACINTLQRRINFDLYMTFVSKAWVIPEHGLIGI